MCGMLWKSWNKIYWVELYDADFFWSRTLALCIHGSASILHLMAQSGADIFHIDWKIDMVIARQQLQALLIQGNLDPCVLLGTRDWIQQHY